MKTIASTILLILLGGVAHADDDLLPGLYDKCISVQHPAQPFMKGHLAQALDGPKKYDVAGCDQIVAQMEARRAAAKAAPIQDAVTRFLAKQPSTSAP